LTAKAATSARSRPGLLRLIAAAIYDFVLIAAVLLVATALCLPFTNGKAIEPNNPYYTAYMFGVWFLLQGWCWVHGGQTLGMRSWKLKLYSEHASPITWKQAAIRFVVALLSWGLLGVGVLWRWVPPRYRSWQDRLSATYVDWAPSRNKDS